MIDGDLCSDVYHMLKCCEVSISSLQFVALIQHCSIWILQMAPVGFAKSGKLIMGFYVCSDPV